MPVHVAPAAVATRRWKPSPSDWMMGGLKGKRMAERRLARIGLVSSETQPRLYSITVFGKFFTGGFRCLALADFWVFFGAGFFVFFLFFFFFFGRAREVKHVLRSWELDGTGCRSGFTDALDRGYSVFSCHQPDHGRVHLSLHSRIRKVQG